MGLIRIMKQTYIAPAVEVLDMEVVEMMAASKDIFISDETTGADAKMAGERHGSWGNRWE